MRLRYILALIAIGIVAIVYKFSQANINRFDFGWAYVLVGMSTILIFMFKIEWLFNMKSFLINLAYGVVLFLVALILIKEGIGDQRFVPALKVPLLSSVVFRLLYFGFIKIYKRNPENTFWVFERKPIEDIVFTGLFWLLGAGLPIVLATL